MRERHNTFVATDEEVIMLATETAVSGRVIANVRPCSVRVITMKHYLVMSSSLVTVSMSLTNLQFLEQDEWMILSLLHACFVYNS